MGAEILKKVKKTISAGSPRSFGATEASLKERGESSGRKGKIIWSSE